MNAKYFLSLTYTLIALNFVIQSIEYLYLLPHLKKQKVWTWKNLKSDFLVFPNFMWKFFYFLFNDKSFVVILFLHATCSLTLFFTHNVISLVCLFILNTLVLMRFRGSFNGGSDYMSMLILTSLILEKIFQKEPLSTQIALGYIGAQSVFSYFIAGWVKIKHHSWRTGQALSDFFQSQSYFPHPLLKKIAKKKSLLIFISFSVLLFELLFPLSLLNPKLTLIFCSLAFFFHSLNSFMFGLNRFIFAWLSSYPAIYFLSTYINSKL